MNEGYKGNSIRTSKYNIITFLPFFLYFMFSRVAYLYFLTQVGSNPRFPCFHLTGLLVRQIYWSVCSASECKGQASAQLKVWREILSTSICVCLPHLRSCTMNGSQLCRML